MKLCIHLAPGARSSLLGSNLCHSDANLCLLTIPFVPSRPLTNQQPNCNPLQNIMKNIIKCLGTIPYRKCAALPFWEPPWLGIVRLPRLKPAPTFLRLTQVPPALGLLGNRNIRGVGTARQIILVTAADRCIGIRMCPKPTGRKSSTAGGGNPYYIGSPIWYIDFTTVTNISFWVKWDTTYSTLGINDFNTQDYASPAWLW